MTTQNLGWSDAIRRILTEAGKPLHYKEIAHRILEKGLRTPSATPEATVAANLSTMFKDGIVARGDERGFYQIQTESNVPLAPEAIREVEEEARLTSVAAYGLYWDRDKVNWEPGRGRGNRQLLGSPDDSDQTIDFANQQGIYILYNRLMVMYVGRTTDNLLARLRAHNSADRRAARWDQFSWFGFRKVNENGTLSDEMENFTVSMLITVLEAVMIEALIPPLNDKGGDLLGTIYRQVEDPALVEQREADFRRMVANAFRGA